MKVRKPRRRRANMEQAFYRSQEWYEARQERLQMDNYRCSKCRSRDRVEVHHIVPISKGGHKTAMSNLQTLCRRHHDKEHAHLYKKSRRETPKFKCAIDQHSQDAAIAESLRRDRFSFFRKTPSRIGTMSLDKMRIK